MLFRRDFEGERRVWVDDGVNGRVHDAAICKPCSDELLDKDPDGRRWHGAQELCLECQTELRASQLLADLFGLRRPFNGDLEGRRLTNDEMAEDPPSPIPGALDYFLPEKDVTSFVGNGHGFLPGSGDAFDPSDGLQPSKEDAFQPGAGDAFGPGPHDPLPNPQDAFVPIPNDRFVPSPGDPILPDPNDPFRPGAGDAFQPGAGHVFQPNLDYALPAGDKDAFQPSSEDGLRPIPEPEDPFPPATGDYQLIGIGDYILPELQQRDLDDA